MRLPRAVPLGAGETPASFASRFAANYGLTAREFCLDWNVQFQRVVDGDREAVAKIAGLGGVPVEALMAHAFVRTEGRSYLHRGQILVRQVLRRSRVHVCPACCLADIEAASALPPEIAPHGRAAWLIEAVRTCPVHRIALTEVAHDLTPNALHDCAHHMAKAVPKLDARLARALRRDPSGLEAYIFGRLDGAPQAAFLDGLPLYVAIRCCEMIGAVAVFGRTANLKRLTDDDWWRAGAAGYPIVAGGPEAIGGFLEDLQRTYPYGRSSNEGPQALFGRLYQWLAFGAENPAYDPLRALLADYIGTHLPLGPGDAVFGRPVTIRTLHSVRTLSKETGLHPKRLRKVLRAAGIVDDDQMVLTYGNAVFPAQEANLVVRRALGAMSFPKAGAYLNAPRVQIELLAKQGFIKPCVPARAFSAADHYAQADLDEFLGRLSAGAVLVKKPKPRQMNIPAAARRACCSAADILNMILDRKLSWVGRLTSERGYIAVLVDVEEIRSKTRGAETGGLTRRPASKRLRTAEKVVDALIKAGHLRTFIARDPINHCPQVLISHEEMDRFCRKYVSLFTLAEELGQHFRRVLKALDARGVEPAFKRKTIGARFYARAELKLDRDSDV